MAKNWYVLYVKSRAEKKLKANFDRFQIENYLPLKTEYRKWSDRVKKVDVPLFSSYIFVHILPKEIPDVLRFPEVVSVLKSEGQYAIVPDKDIENVRRFEECELTLEVGRVAFGIGEEVEVVAGPLKGMTGELIEKSGQSRFVLRLNVLDQVIKVQLPAYQLNRL